MDVPRTTPTKQELLGRMPPSAAWFVVWVVMSVAWLLLVSTTSTRFAVVWTVACQLVTSFASALSGWRAVRDVRFGRPVSVMYATDWLSVGLPLLCLLALPLWFSDRPDRLMAAGFLVVPLFGETLLALRRMRLARGLGRLSGLAEVFE